MPAAKHKPTSKPAQEGAGKSKKDKSKNKFPENLYLATNGTSWILDFTFKGNRYKENLGPVSRTTAKEIRQRRIAAAAEGRLEPPSERIEDQPFDKVCDKYLEWSKEHVRPRSYERNVTSSIALKAFLGSKMLSKIGPLTIEVYKMDRKTGCSCVTKEECSKASQRCSICKHFLRPKSNVTINRELTMLKTLLYRAVEWRFLRESPMKRVKFLPEGKGRTRFLSLDEAKKLLRACNEDFRDVVLMALHSGCRKSEINTLTWPNVDLVQRTFTVVSAYAKNHETKTLPMTDEVFEMLKRRRADRDSTPDNLVFVSRYNKPWRSWSTAWQNACERAGLEDFRFHDLRHCFGSWLAMNGTAPKAMMELMGHKTASMTMRYSHLSVEYKRQAVAKLPTFGNLETEPADNVSEFQTRVISLTPIGGKV